MDDPDGKTFFEVRTKDGMRYTRNGSFLINKDSYLVTKDGSYVMGEKGRIRLKKNNFSVNEQGEIMINRDLQEDKLHIFNAADVTSACLAMATAIVSNTKFGVVVYFRFIFLFSFSFSVPAYLDI